MVSQNLSLMMDHFGGAGQRSADQREGLAPVSTVGLGRRRVGVARIGGGGCSAWGLDWVCLKGSEYLTPSGISGLGQQPRPIRCSVPAMADNFKA